MDNAGSYLSGRKVFVGGLSPNLSLALFDDHFKQYVFALPHVSLYIDNEVLSLTHSSPVILPADLAPLKALR